jgi:CRP-like cAMP-binding protein
VACLHSAPLFQGLARQALEELASAAHARQLRAKHAAFHEGDPAREVWLLTAGRVKVTQLTASGDVVIQRISSRGELVSGIDFGGRATYATTPIALEACDLLAWPAGEFEAYGQRYPRLQRNALRILASRLREMEERYSELATQRVAARLARTLVRLLGQIGQPRGELVAIELSREELGQLIGTNLFTVSRLLCQWESDGLVASAREAVLVKDPAGLVALAELEGGDAAGLRSTGRSLRG